MPGQGWGQIVAFLGVYELFINKPAAWPALLEGPLGFSGALGVLGRHQDDDDDHHHPHRPHRHTAIHLPQHQQLSTLIGARKKGPDAPEGQNYELTP